MTCLLPRPVWNRPLGHTFLVVCVACVVVAPPALAGLGDMLKKAKASAKKAVQAPAPEAAKPCEEVVFDDAIVELTDPRIESILATYKAAGDAGAGRPALVEKLNKVNDERASIDEKHGEAIRETQRKRGDIETCYHDGYQAAQDRRAEEYRQRALSDPALLAKFQRAAADNNAAAAKGDSAATKRLMDVMREETAPTREDTMKVRKECGPLPPKSAVEQRLDELDKQAKALMDQIAKVDDDVANAQAKQGGMNRGQWGMAIDRIYVFLAWKRNPTKTPPCGLTKAEIAALEKHFEALHAVLG